MQNTPEDEDEFSRVSPWRARGFEVAILTKGTRIVDGSSFFEEEQGHFSEAVLASVNEPELAQYIVVSKMIGDDVAVFLPFEAFEEASKT